MSLINRNFMMKKILLYALLLGSLSACGQKNMVKGKINGINPGDTIYLGAYSGKSLQYNDTSIVSKNGWFEFEGKTKEKAGKHVVFVVNPSVKMVEVLLDDKDVVFETDTTNMDFNMKIKTSETNQIFYDYKKYITQKNKERVPLDELCGDSTLTEAEREVGCEQIRDMTREVIAEQKRIAKEHGNLLIGKYLNMGIEIDVPDAPEDAEDAVKWRYNYYKAHYWDHTDLDDPGIFREQQFHKVFEKYFKQVVSQKPDSVFNEGVKFLNRVQKNEDLFKYSLSQLAYITESSNIMCMDKAFVLFVNKYYKTGVVDWLDDERLAKIIEGATKKEPCLCGEIASNIILPDENDVWQSLHKIDSKYTVLVFWEPSCGHCKKEMPKIKAIYDKWGGKGLEVYAVCHDLENEKWIEFIKEKELDWINVSFNQEIMNNDSAAVLMRRGITDINSLNYSKIYDITSTPQIYLLDENKEIVLKQLKSEQLAKMMDDFLGGESESNESSKDQGAVIEEDEHAPTMTDEELKKKQKSKSRELMNNSTEAAKG